VDLAVLNNCRRARGAAYQHGNRRGCLRGTREVVLNEIESWTKDCDKSPVFWLNGLAGTGKSTIAQTIAERAFADGLLGASFFCSRDFEDRSDLHFIFPTLAFQLAHKFPGFRAHLVSLLRSNPDIVDESLYNQMERLVVEPLRSAEVSTVIVVDALDECKDDEPSSAILSVLGRLVGQIPRVKFFITGRPEPRIKTGFRLPLLEDATKVFVLHDVHPELINNDILLFLKHELSDLACRRQLEGWPSDDHISLLCQRAAGLFIYAVATVKFLDKTHLPERRLDVIVNLPHCTIPEGRTQVKPRTTLDTLYMSVLQMAFSGEDPEVDFKLRSVIGAVVLLVNPLPPSGIAELTNLNPREVKLLLTSVQSLLILDENPTQPVKSFHKSFPDFVTDPSRCVDSRFYISPESLHLQLAVNCLRVLNNGLEQNLLDLPDYVLNSEVKDLQRRIDGRISVVLRYACQSWHNHLSMSRGDVTDVISHIRSFMEEKFLAWLEVLSVLKSTRVAVVALEKLMAWLQEVCLTFSTHCPMLTQAVTQVSRNDQLVDTARDCLYFVTNFFEPISVSATHIYHSALELSPRSSMIRKLHYHRRLARFPRVEIGIQDSWDPSIAISTDSSRESWSPCGQFIAIQTGGAVKIRDVLTLEVVSTFQLATDRFFEFPPSYSPDGRFLACFAGVLIIWDIQTGGVVEKIKTHFPKAFTWSPGGGAVVVLSYDGDVSMYDVASGTAMSTTTYNISSSDYSYLWAHNESLRVLTTAKDNETTTIDIFEFGPAQALTKIGLFSVQLENKHKIGSFSPTTYRISVSVENLSRLVILDIRNLGRLLVEEGNSDLCSHSFSSDGSHFAASLSGSFHIWNYDGSCYIPWRLFSFPLRYFSRILFSPTSPSILAHWFDTLRLLRLDSPSIASTTHMQQLDVTYHGKTPIPQLDVTYHGKTITINSLSQTQFIDTYFKIAGLGLTGNVLIVKGPKVVVAWLLTEESVSALGNRRASHDDSIWTISTTPHCHLKFSVEGEAGVIKSGKTLHIYNLRTGDILEPMQEPPRFSGLWYSFNGRGSMPIVLPNGNLKVSLGNEWLKDHQGKCLLWRPIEWRSNSKSEVEWFPNSTINFKSRDGNAVMIKLHDSTKSIIIASRG